MLATLGVQWRVLESGADSGTRNMATDAALLAHARRTGEATLRLYGWSRRTLSLGRHERARGLYDLDRLAAAHVDVVRRPTGGRALLHHHELTYSVTAPADGISLAESYRAINALLLDALARLGVAAEEAPRTPGTPRAAREHRARTLRPEGAACFAEPAAGELTWRGAKLAGSAQLREDGAFLQHGSILIEDEQALIDALRIPSLEAPRGGREANAAGAPPAARGAATLTEALGRPVTPSEAGGALRASLLALVGGARPVTDLDARSLQAALARLEDAFASDAWTWRR